MRMLWLVAMPPREMTATSVVPPPMSTTMLPVGSLTGRPAPIAAGTRSPVVVNPPGARLVPGLLDRGLLDAGDAAGHRHHDARLGHPGPAVDLLDEVAQHPL